MDGLLIVISGFSGVGKGTLVKKMLADYPEDFALSVSATSRGPRPGEEDGKDYFFRSREEFEKMIADGGLLEYTEYAGNFYGTPKCYVEDQLKSGKNVILEIEVEGALNIRRLHPDAFLIYVIAPSAETVYKRLKGRGTEDAEKILRRMQRAADETASIGEYDYVVINDDLDICEHEIRERIDMQKKTLNYKKYLVPELRDEFIALLKEEM